MHCTSHESYRGEGNLLNSALSSLEKEAEKAVEKGDYKGIIKLSFNEEKLPEATYKAMSIADSSLFTDLQTSLQQLKTMLAASQINLTPVQLQKREAHSGRRRG